MPSISLKLLTYFLGVSDVYIVSFLFNIIMLYLLSVYQAETAVIYISV